MRFIIESSTIPIYKRIALAFGNALSAMGHEVIFISQVNDASLESIKQINELNADYYFSTNEYNLIQKYHENSKEFYFEKIKSKIIFIHHDNIFANLRNIELIKKKCLSLKNIEHRSTHFCIEDSNIEDLKALGFNNVHKIWHASELQPLTLDKPKYNVSFVGHFFPSLDAYPKTKIENDLPKHLAAYKLKQLDLGFEASKYYANLVRQDESIPSDPLSQFAHKQALVDGFTELTLPMRGEILNAINVEKIDVFGGDLSQSLDRRSPYKIQNEKFQYYMPTIDYADVNKVYADSKFNINISSFQMDSAVNNRIIDVALSGGFLLTDKKNDLEKISPFFSEITFSTPLELNELIEKYSSNSNLYVEIKEVFFHSIFEKFTYKNQIEKVIKLI
jgi:hypothetical protein